MAFSPTLLGDRVGIVTGAGPPHGIGRSLVLSLAATGNLDPYAEYTEGCSTEHLSSRVRAVKQFIAQYGHLDFFSPIRALDATSEFYRRPECRSSLAASHKPLQDTDAAYYDNTMSIMQRFFFSLYDAGQGMGVSSAERTKPAGSP
ncbi:hypothetical protein TOPH_06128 [Tolypocladium ophioglossoides CBS 100239]|uniref:Uncharacterized protein n=1 Tax=Tolypocladium ophioglossoides (strain CBS 100239) TaxID=1163406 RepID=A0A0L0N590_TOLOC|nr:hypothetical protein TOPH_06128 [Tolypocladium ophioglossoides CBS 100239]